MPQFIAYAVWAVSAIGAEVGSGFLIIYAAEIVSAAILIGSLALSSAAAQRAKSAAKDAYNSATVDRLVNSKLTAAPRELVLGRVRKGGNVFFEGTAGTNKTIFMRAIAIAGHEIMSVDQIYFDDVPVTLDGSGNVTTAPFALAVTKSGQDVANGSGVAVLSFTPLANSVTAVTIVGSFNGQPDSQTYINETVSVTGNTVTTAPGAYISYQYSDYASRAKVTWHLGIAGQPADTRLMALFPEWTSAHQAQGVAYLVCEFNYSETAFPTGLPVVTALVRGARDVIDPRDGLPHWTDNPALLMRHVYTHPKFGKAETVTAAEDASFIAAANACDISQTYTVGGVGTAKPMFRAALVVQEGAPANGIFDDLSQAMGGMWAYAGGEIYLKPGVYTGPVMALADADLAVVQRDASGSASQSPISISPHRERASKFNSVAINIWDDAQDYKQVALTPLTGAALVARDGALLTHAVTYSAIGYAPQAQHVAGIMMRDARDPLTVKLPFKLIAYPIKLFDTVSLTLARYGWAAKTFILMQREWSPAGFVLLTLKETGAAIYQPDATFLPQGYLANTTLPKPWDVPTPGPLTVTSGDVALIIQTDGTVVNRMRVSWPALTDAAVITSGVIEVQFRRVSDTGAWTSAPPVPGSETATLLENVQDTVYYIIRARARTTVAVGNWSPQVLHRVQSKASGPPNFDTFDMTFGVDGTRVVTFAYTSTPRPKDLAGARIKFVSGFVASPPWASMSLLDPALFGGGFETTNGNPGSYTFAIKAVDTSGNESIGTIYIQRTLPVMSPGGAAAQLLSLSVTGYAFIFTDAQATASTSPDVSFTAVLTNVSGTATFVATAFNSANASLGAVTLGGAGSNVRTLSAAQFNNSGALATTYVKVVATLGGLSDTSSVFRANSGTDGLISILSNEAHTVPTAADGSAGIFTDASGIIKVYQGIVDVTSLWTFTAAGSAVGGTFNGSALPVTVGVTGVASPAYAATSMSADAGTITITGTRTGYPTQTKVFSIAKSKAGNVGATGATGATGTSGAAGSAGQSARVAYVVNTNPAVPGAVSAGAGDVAPTSAAGTWSFAATSTLAAGQYMYQVDGLYTAGGNIAWGNPYLSNLKVGSLSAISADLGTIIAGTITGALIRTAATGRRVELDAAAMRSFDASNNPVISVGLANGVAGITVDSSATGNLVGALVVSNSGFGVTINAGNTGGGQAVYAQANTGVGVQGVSASGQAGKFTSSSSAFGAVIGTPSIGLAVTGPMTIDNSTLVTNLNAERVGGFLASELGSNFLQAGAGALTRTTQNKLREQPVSIQDYTGNVVPAPTTANAWYWDYTNPDNASQLQLVTHVPATVAMAGSGQVQGTGLIFRGDTSAQTPGAGLAESNMIRMTYEVKADAGPRLQVHLINGLLIVANDESGSGNESAVLIGTARSTGPLSGTRAVGVWGADMHVEKFAGVLDGSMCAGEFGVHKGPALGAAKCIGLDVWSGDRSGITASRAGTGMLMHGNAGWTNFLKILHNDEATDVMLLDQNGNLTVRSPLSNQSTLLTTNQASTTATLQVAGYTSASANVVGVLQAQAGGQVVLGSNSAHDFVLVRGNIELLRGVPNQITISSASGNQTLVVKSIANSTSGVLNIKGRDSAGNPVTALMDAQAGGQVTYGSVSAHDVVLISGNAEVLRFVPSFIFSTPLSAQESAGSGTPLLGANCPAGTTARPTTWLRVRLSGGANGFIPVWV